MEYKQVRVGSRTVYYTNSLLCYNNRFDLPVDRTSTVTVQHPDCSERLYTATVETLNKEINAELHYWLYQLWLTSEALSEKTGLAEYPEHNLDVIYTQLSSILNLDEQLRCKLLHSHAQSLYKELYPNHLRLYTAIYRLSSFVNYGNTKFRVESLA